MKTLIASALALFSSAVQAQTLPDSTSWYLFEGNPAQVRQYVMEVGKGPTVVVIHGGYGAEHSYLLKPFLPLSGKHHLVFYDQRGSLRSPAGTHEVSLPKLVDDLEALRQELGQDKLVLLTHSMGATTAMAYLARYPERVRGLVLTAPALPTDKERGTFEAPLDPALLDAEEQKLADARFAQFWQEEAARVAKVKAALPPASSGGAPTAGTYRQRSDQWRVDFAGGEPVPRRALARDGGRQRLLSARRCRCGSEGQEGTAWSIRGIPPGAAGLQRAGAGCDRRP